jgi:hypothetical protein
VIDHDNITPPPSLADILSGGEDLIGRVDFGSRLVPEARAVEAPAATATRTRTPKAVSAAAPETAPRAAAAPKPKPRASAKATLRPTLKRVVPPAVVEPAAEADHETEQDDETGQYDRAELRETEQDEQLGEHEDFADEDDFQFTAFAEPAPAPRAYTGGGRVSTRRRTPSLSAPSTVPEEDVAYLGLSVEEVAESARVRMRSAELAHLRHLEAVENEAARRLELLTAQAELDAELIRLHARREAHAIVSAARTRTGAGSGPSRAERRLAEVGGSFSRFAETLESTLEASLSPDHRYDR